MGEQESWTTEKSQLWRSTAIEAVAKIERVVKADQESQEPILGRLQRPETSLRTHLAVRHAVATISRLVEELPPSAPTADELLESIYQDLTVPLTQRCLLRTVVMDAYSHARREKRPVGVELWDETSEGQATRSDVFAIPAYGSPQAALYLLSQRDSLSRLCSLVERSGFVGEHQVALLSVPLSVDAIHRVDVLKAIMDLEFSAETLHDNGDTTVSGLTPPEKALQVLARHVPQGRSAFVVAGVRVRKDNQLPDVLNHFAKGEAPADPMHKGLDPVSRGVNTMWWNTVVSRIVVQSNVNANDLVFRPPTGPVRAQTQARAMALIHELYDRLAGRPFVRMEFENVRFKDSPASPLMMALSAFDHKGERIAMSRPASLFEVGLGEDFQDVLQEEMAPGRHAPLSMIRQELLEDFKIKFDGLPGTQDLTDEAQEG